MAKCKESAEGTFFYREFSGYWYGQSAQSHPHNYPHDLQVRRGKVEVTNTYPDGRVEVYRLKAGEHRRIEAVADHHVKAVWLWWRSAWSCVFPHRDKNGKLSDKCEGAREAYQ